MLGWPGPEPRPTSTIRSRSSRLVRTLSQLTPRTSSMRDRGTGCWNATIASVSYAAGESFPETSGRKARRTAAANSGRVARWISSWCRITITPRPSSAPRSSSSACSTAVRSASVACCSSRSLRGRLELNRIASSVAEISLTGGVLPCLALGFPPPLPLAHDDQGSPEQLQDGDEGHDRFEAILRLQDQLHELDRAAAQAIGDEVQLLLQSPGPARDHQRTRRSAR